MERKRTWCQIETEAEERAEQREMDMLDKLLAKRGLQSPPQTGTATTSSKDSRQS